MTHPALQRAEQFCRQYQLQHPVVMAPMAGVTHHALPLAFSATGGMAAFGALMHAAPAMEDWVLQFRGPGGGPLLLNLWMPEPAPAVPQPDHEAALRRFLAGFGPEVPAHAADAPLHDVHEQLEMALALRPAVLSTIMGLLPPERVAQARAAGVAWWATVTTVAEARLAEAAGADVIVAQGAEAGGHRGAFVAAHAQRDAVGLMSLLPQVVDAVQVPVVAAGGVGDARGVAAALLLGASAVQVGTALLRTPEAAVHPAWAGLLAVTAPEDTQLTRAFSGRWGRALATDYVRAAAAPEAPEPAAYPRQRGLTAAMRADATSAGDVHRMQAWAGQSAGLAQAMPAEDWLRQTWQQVGALLG